MEDLKLALYMIGGWAAIFVAVRLWVWVSCYFYGPYLDQRWRERMNRRQRNCWEPWYAWRPVKTVGGRRIWLKRIYRQPGNDYIDYDNWTWYFYGDEFDILRSQC